MNHGLAIGPLFVNGEMHLDFAADFARAKGIALQVNDHQIGFSEMPLTNAAGGREQVAIIQANCEIAFGCSYEVSLPQAPSCLNEGSSRLDFGHSEIMIQLRLEIRHLTHSADKHQDEIAMVNFDNVEGNGQSLVAYLCVKDADKMLDFYKRAFNAEVVSCMRMNEGEPVMHAEVKIGHNSFYINDEFPDWGALSPATTGKTSSSIHIQVSEGLDELYNQAISAGATSLAEPEDQFWGDRFCMFSDPSGHKWSIGMKVGEFQMPG